ncbi:MAG: hypothetical protein AB9866_11105 [Syntrophobacteraceae bacterium]
MKKCPHCGNEFTLETDKCPKCEGAIPRKPNPFYGFLKWTFILGGGGFCLLLVAVFISLGLESPEQKEARKVRLAADEQHVQVVATSTTTTTTMPVQPPQKANKQEPKSKKSKAKQKDLTDSKEAGMRLLALQAKGYIELTIAEPSTFLLIEPKAWQAMLHKDKIDLCNLAWAFVDGLNRKGKRVQFVIVEDMTKRKTLARVFLQEGRVEILK